MKPIRITPKADQDVDQCFEWIHSNNPETGRRFLDAVDQTYVTISQMPGIGSRRYADLSLMPGVRMIKVKGFEHYLLFYLEREDRIDVVRVLHSARNLPQALRESE